MGGGRGRSSVAVEIVQIWGFNLFRFQFGPLCVVLTVLLSCPPQSPSLPPPFPLFLPHAYPLTSPPTLAPPRTPSQPQTPHPAETLGVA